MGDPYQFVRPPTRPNLLGANPRAPLGDAEFDFPIPNNLPQFPIGGQEPQTAGQPALPSDFEEQFLSAPPPIEFAISAVNNAYEAAQKGVERERTTDLLPWRTKLDDAFKKLTTMGEKGGGKEATPTQAAGQVRTRIDALPGDMRNAVLKLKSPNDLAKVFPEAVLTFADSNPSQMDLWQAGLFLADHPTAKISGFSTGLPREVTEEQKAAEQEYKQAVLEHDTAEEQLGNLAVERYKQVTDTEEEMDLSAGPKSLWFRYIKKNPYAYATIAAVQMAVNYLGALQSGVSIFEPEMQDEERKIREMLHAYNPKMFADPSSTIQDIVQTPAFKALALKASQAGSLGDIAGEQRIQAMQAESLRGGGTESVEMPSGQTVTFADTPLVEDYTGSRELAEKAYEKSWAKVGDQVLGTTLEIGAFIVLSGLTNRIMNKTALSYQRWRNAQGDIVLDPATGEYSRVPKWTVTNAPPEPRAIRGLLGKGMRRTASGQAMLPFEWAKDKLTSRLDKALGMYAEAGLDAAKIDWTPILASLGKAAAQEEVAGYVAGLLAGEMSSQLDMPIEQAQAEVMAKLQPEPEAPAPTVDEQAQIEALHALPEEMEPVKPKTTGGPYEIVPPLATPEPTPALKEALTAAQDAGVSLQSMENVPLPGKSGDYGAGVEPLTPPQQDSLATQIRAETERILARSPSQRDVSGIEPGRRPTKFEPKIVISETKALANTMKAMAKGGRAGYKAGVQAQAEAQAVKDAAAANRADVKEQRTAQKQGGEAIKQRMKGKEAGRRDFRIDKRMADTELIKQLEKALPREERPAFIRTIKNINPDNPKTIEAAAAKLDKAVEAYDRKDAIRGYDKAIKKMGPTKGLGPVQKQAVEATLEDVTRRAPKAALTEKFKASLEAAERLEKDFGDSGHTITTVPSHVIKRAIRHIESLEKTPIPSMAADDIRALTKDIELATKLDALKKGLKAGRADKQIDSYVRGDVAYGRIGRGKTVDLENLERRHEKYWQSVTQWGKLLGKYRLNQPVLWKWLAGYNSWGAEIMGKRLTVDAVNDYLRILHTATDDFAAWIESQGHDNIHTWMLENSAPYNKANKDGMTKKLAKKALGRTPTDAKLLTSEIGMPTGTAYWLVENKSGSGYNRGGAVKGTVKLTTGEMARLLCHFLDPDTRAAILGGRGLVFESSEEFTRPITLTAEGIEHIVNQATEEEIALADFLFKQFNGQMKDAVNRVTVELTGSERFQQDQHVPRQTARKIGLKTNPKTNMTMQVHGKPVEMPGFFEDRAMETDAPIYVDDAINHFFQYSHQVGHFAGFAIPLRDAQAYLLHPEIEKAIVTAHGRSVYGRLKTDLGRIEQQSLMTRDDLNIAARWILSRVYTVAIGAKPHIALFQMASLPMVMTDVSAKNWGKGMAAALKPGAQKEAIDFLLKYSDMFKSRHRGGVTGILGVAVNDMTKTLGQAAKEWPMAMAKAGDTWAVSAPQLNMARAEISEKHPNLAGEEYDKAVVTRYEELLLNDNPTFTGNFAQLSEMRQRARAGETVPLLLSPFSSFGDMIINKVVDALVKYRDSAKTAADKKKLIGTYAVMGLTLAISEAIRRSSYKLRHKDDDESFMSGLIRGYLVNLASLPFAGINEVRDTMENLIRMAQGRPVWGRKNSPGIVGSFFADFKNLAMAIGSMGAGLANDDEKQYEKGRKDFNRAIVPVSGYVTNLPTVGIKQAGEYLTPAEDKPEKPVKRVKRRNVRRIKKIQ